MEAAVDTQQRPIWLLDLMPVTVPAHAAAAEH